MRHFASAPHGLERKPVLGSRAVEGGYTWHGLSRPWRGEREAAGTFFLFACVLLMELLVCVPFSFGGA